MSQIICFLFSWLLFGLTNCFSIIWYTEQFCKFLVNQASLWGHSVFKTNRRISSFQSYKNHFCSFHIAGEIKPKTFWPFFWNTLYMRLFLSFIHVIHLQDTRSLKTSGAFVFGEYLKNRNCFSFEINMQVLRLVRLVYIKNTIAKKGIYILVGV